jgi:uncharacterized protein YaaN involved in tellurite resistance
MQTMTSATLPATISAQPPFTMGELATYGNNDIQGISAVAQSINASTRASDLDEVGNLVGKILVVAQGYDPTKIKAGGGFLGMFKGKAQSFKNRFTSVDTQINELKGQLVKHQQTLIARIPQMEQLAIDIKARHDAMEKTVEVARARIAWMEVNKPAVPEGDTFAAQELDTWNKVIDMAKMRVHDLELMMNQAEIQVPRIGQMQQQAVILVQKLQNIIDLVIPSWQTLLAEYIQQLGIKKTGELADSVADSFNAAQQASAKLGRQNAVAIAKTQQRGVLDMDTIKTVQSEFLTSLTEVRQIAEEGARRRDQERPELERLSVELQKALANQPTTAV